MVRFQNVTGWIAAALALTGSVQAWAGSDCLDNPKCDPDRLCLLKAEYLSKDYTYNVYAQNSIVRVPGVKYNGTLRNGAINGVNTDFPNMSPDQKLQQAGAVFEKSVEQYVRNNFKVPGCRPGAQINDKDVAPEKYGGMFTTPACRISVNFEGGDINPGGFGARLTMCQQIIDRDYAHEKIHKMLCEAAKAQGAQAAGRRLQIDNVIKEELITYDHSRRLSEAYMMVASLQCSANAKPAEMKRRLDVVQKILKEYEGKK